MIRGAIFDIDGTLLDSMPIWSDVGARYLRSIGVEPEANLGEILFTMSLEEGVDYLKNHYLLHQTEEVIRSGVLGIIEHFYRNEVPLKTGVKAFLHHLQEKDIPMVLATTSDRELITAALTRLGVMDCFACLLTASELRTTKHEPLIYQKAAAFMGTAPEETAVFEDTYYALKTAKDSGFPAIGVEDAASAADRAAIQEISDFYITDYNFISFWEFAAK